MINHDGFHASDGWYFQRGEDGTVTISAAVQRSTEQVTLDAATWASVIASMSAAGETATTFHAARLLHSGGANTDG
jgi:hypothetical protein